MTELEQASALHKTLLPLTMKLLRIEEAIDFALLPIRTEHLDVKPLQETRDNLRQVFMELGAYIHGLEKKYGVAHLRGHSLQ